MTSSYYYNCFTFILPSFLCFNISKRVQVDPYVKVIKINEYF